MIYKTQHNILSKGVLIKSLARPTSLSIAFSVQETGGNPTGPDPQNKVGDKTLEAQVGQFLLGCKCPVSYFLPGRAKGLSAPLHLIIYFIGEQQFQ
jgi:hypothetical protein